MPLAGIDTCADDATDGQGGPGTTSRYADCYPFVSAPTSAQMEAVCAIGANPTSIFTDVTAAAPTLAFGAAEKTAMGSLVLFAAVALLMMPI